MSHRVRLWIDGFLYAFTVSCIVVCILLIYAMMSGCSQAERVKMTAKSVETAVDTGYDRIEETVTRLFKSYAPKPLPQQQIPQPVSPLQGLIGAAGMMAVYLIRKRFFPMGKR